MTCPTYNNEECGGRGRCLSLREMAPLATRQGYPLGDPEIQVINCSLSSHNFTLDLNYHRSIPIQWYARADAVQYALELMPTSGFVEVTADPGPAVCSEAGTLTRVTFQSDLGDVPQMKARVPSTGATGSISVTTEQDGTQVSYGLTDGDLDTWDADQIHACYCDGGINYNQTRSADTPYSYETTGGETYMGYQGAGVATEPDPRNFMGLACEFRPCPTGMDPLSASSVLAGH